MALVCMVRNTLCMKRMRYVLSFEDKAMFGALLWGLVEKYVSILPRGWAQKIVGFWLNYEVWHRSRVTFALR